MRKIIVALITALPLLFSVAPIAAAGASVPSTGSPCVTSACTAIAAHILHGIYRCLMAITHMSATAP